MLKLKVKLSFFFFFAVRLFLSLCSLSFSYPHFVPLSTWPCLTHYWVFLWRRGSQAEFIRLRSKGGKEKKPMGASWGKIAYPGVNPRTGAQVNWLPALTASVLAQKHRREISRMLFFCGKKITVITLLGDEGNLHIVWATLIFIPSSCVTITWYKYSHTCTRIAPTPICMTLISGESHWGVKSVMGS